MSDEQQIRALIQTYFDSMAESSGEKVREAFHPNGRLVGYLPDGLHELGTEDFAGLVASQEPSPKESGATLHAEIISLQIAGDSAMVQVRDDYLGLRFFDTLSLIKADGRWQIYCKLFHVESEVG
ncbi:MAG: nuclear transport factor 2 family protein [Pseudomonadota bacterium]